MEPVKPTNLDSLFDGALAVGGESVDFDFKLTRDLSSVGERIKLVKTITGFANSENGGYIVVGISDDGTVTGVTAETEKLFDQTQIKKFLKKYVAPMPSFQVHRHSYQGCRVIVIRVDPFVEVPHVVVQGTTNDGVSLSQGTVIVRTLGAECAPIDSETEIRRLCDTIVRRRASQVVDLFQRGSVGMQTPLQQSTDSVASLESIADKTTELWTSDSGSGLNFMEVFFEPITPMTIDRQMFTDLVESTRLILGNGDDFPPYRIRENNVATLKSTGWVCRLPHNTKEPAWYAWLLTVEGRFVYRQRFWEDRSNSVIPHGVGLYHVIEQLIMLVRFVDRVAKYLALDVMFRFRLGMKIVGAEGRYLANELNPSRSEPRRISDDDIVKAEMVVSLDSLRRNVESRYEVVATLCEQIAWGMNRTDLTRDRLLVYISAAKNIDAAYAFPSTETLHEASLA